MVALVAPRNAFMMTQKSETTGKTDDAQPGDMQAQKRRWRREPWIMNCTRHPINPHNPAHMRRTRAHARTHIISTRRIWMRLWAFHSNTV